LPVFTLSRTDVLLDASSGCRQSLVPDAPASRIAQTSGLRAKSHNPICVDEQSNAPVKPAVEECRARAWLWRFEMRILLVGMAFGLCACASAPDRKPAETHVCTVIPNGMVECNEIGKAQ